MLIFRIALQLCAAASRFAASASAMPSMASTNRRIKRDRFVIMPSVGSSSAPPADLVLLRRRGPGRHIFLGHSQQRRERHAQNAERHDWHEHLVYLVGARGAHDEVTDAGDRGVEI